MQQRQTDISHLHLQDPGRSNQGSTRSFKREYIASNSYNEEVIYYPKESIRRAIKDFPTPFFIYEEKCIRDNCQRIMSAFKPRFERFQPLYAVKANSNPHVLNLIKEEGFGFDCSSPSEIWIVDAIDG